MWDMMQRQGYTASGVYLDPAQYLTVGQPLGFNVSRVFNQRNHPRHRKGQFDVGVGDWALIKYHGGRIFFSFDVLYDGFCPWKYADWIQNPLKSPV